VQLPAGTDKLRRGLQNLDGSLGAGDLPSFDDISSMDFTNDDDYNRILTNIAKQRSTSTLKSRRVSKKSLQPLASNWATATRSSTENVRRRPQASPLGAARLASASARLCAIENAVLGLRGIDHMEDFLELKRKSLVHASTKWQAHLLATQRKKSELQAELEAHSEQNRALHAKLQEDGLDRALDLLEGLLAKVGAANKAVAQHVDRPDSAVAKHYAQHGGLSFQLSPRTSGTNSLGRKAHLTRQRGPSRPPMSRATSMFYAPTDAAPDPPRRKIDEPAKSMASALVQRAQSSQEVDDMIVCILSAVEALRSTYCVRDLLENDAQIQWFPFAEMEQSNEDLENAIKSMAAENRTIQETLSLTEAAASNIQRMTDDVATITENFFKIDSAKEEAVVDVLRASRSVKVTSSLLSMQTDLHSVFPNTSSQDTSQVEWSNDKGEMNIKNASLDSLLSIVTAPADASNAYLNAIKRTFFFTFRYYLTVPELLEKLVLRFCMCPPQTIPSTPSQANYSGMESVRTRVQQPDRDGIMCVIHQWVEDWFDLDFRPAPEHLEMLQLFLRNTAAKCGCLPAADAIEALIARMLTQGSALDADAHPSGPEEDYSGADLGSLGAEMGALEALKISSIMDISPQVLAEQLTLIESEDYVRVRPDELLRQAWNKKDKEQKAPNLVRTFRHFNSVSALFVTAILAEGEVEARAGVIRHVLVVGMHFLRLNNYNGVVEVVSALQSSAVERLWLSWNFLGKHLYAAKQLLCQVTANNMQVFRCLWKETATPSIPYVGVFLTDLTFLEDGNPTWADGQCTLVNMFKFRMIEHTISVLLGGQATGKYDIEPDPAVQAFFTDLLNTAPRVNEDGWYRMSLSLESREAVKQAEHYRVKYEFESVEAAAKTINHLREHPLIDGKDISFMDEEVELAGGAHLASGEHSEQRKRANAVADVKFTTLDLDNIASRMRAAGSGVQRKDRRFRMKLYHQAFLGTDAVDWLVSHESKLASRGAAVKLGKMLVKLHYIRHVNNDHSFKDKPHLYQFVDGARRR